MEPEVHRGTGVRFPRPLLHVDTVHVESEVLSSRPSRSRPKQDIVVFEHRAFNQRNEVVDLRMVGVDADA